MIKIAIFVEGQTELIFVRELLQRSANLAKISFECLELRAGQENPVNFEYTNPYAEVHFFILNVGNDNKVLSAIKEKEARLFNNGYDRIIGLRDMYSRAYREYSPGEINEEFFAEIIGNVTFELAKTSNPDKIGFYFAIMEVEAWILAMYNLFEKIDKKLTVEYIEEKLKFNLKDIDL